MKLLLPTLLQDVLGKDTEPPKSLLEAHHLGDKADESIKTFLSRQGGTDYKHFPMKRRLIVLLCELMP